MRLPCYGVCADTAVMPEIAGYTNCCWLTQVATLAGACLQLAHEDHTQAYRSVIFAVHAVLRRLTSSDVLF